MTDPHAGARAPKTRFAVVSEDYMDGIMGVFVREVSEFDETRRRVPVDLLAAFEAAESAWREAGRKLMAAYNAAPEVKNPKYEPYDANA